MLHPNQRYVNVYNITISAPHFKEPTPHELKWITIHEEDKKI